MSYDILLKNASVIDPYQDVDGKRDIAITDGKISDIREEISGEADNVIDLEGNLVMPGVIDIHTHVTRLLGGPLGYKMMAQTGVTTAIDFAGPIADIVNDLNQFGSGLNVGGLEGLIPGLSGRKIETNNPSSAEIEDNLHAALNDGALGFKLMGGHYPLTPEATEAAIETVNNHHAMVAFHAGTTASASDMTGMREAYELAKDNRLLLAHINAYCRGNVHHPFDELKEALQLVQEHDNVFSESHLATINGTSGDCEKGKPKSGVTRMSLKRLGFSVDEAGIEEAIGTKVAHVHKTVGGINKLVTGNEGIEYWREHHTDVGMSFPMNLPTIAVGCVVERVKPGGDFVIDINSTDGGGIPRNDLLGRLLALVQLGYLSLSEMVTKISLTPAQMFGLTNKGHLGVGADADITVINKQENQASMSFANGKLIMKDGIVLGEKGQMIVTEHGVRAAEKANIAYQVNNLKDSMFYADL